jgi:hypothetical protein
MDRIERIRSRPALVIGACGLIAAGGAAVAATDAHAADRALTLSLTAAPDLPQVLDLGAAGKSPGDLYVFSSTVDDASGAPAGRVLGTQTSIALEGRAETVAGSLTYELADGQIVVGGLGQYPLGGRGLRPGRPYVRPVLGGTGRYAGAHGSQTAVQGKTGPYQLRFSLRIPGGPATTVAMRAPNGQTTVLDLGATGTTTGDLRVLAGNLTDAAGALIGRIRGTQTTIVYDGATHVVQAQISYELPDGEIVVGGISEQLADGSDLVPGRSFVRPVLGGTGRYAGAGGTLTSTLGADRAFYDHRFDLLGVATAPKVVHTVRFLAPAATVHDIDLGAPGKTPGDLYVFAGPLTDSHGHAIGRIRGDQTSIAIDDGAETVQLNATYQFRDGQVVVGGLSQYPLDPSNNPIAGRTFVRSVLGGTGRYEGAHGTMTTVRRSDGTFQQTLRFVR